MVDISAYLTRIRYSGPTDPTAKTLRDLHRAHMFAVPFENLDISRGRKIVIDEGAILQKVVHLRRGGFCYELNCAFAALLRTLEFQVTLLSARVARADGGEGPEFDHLTLRVDLDESWLADVGFGDSFVEPLRLDPEHEQSDPAGIFRIVEIRDCLQMEKADRAGDWKPQYSFTLQPRQIQEFAGMCHYHQTSPDSSFTQKRVCSLATAEGRITLSELKLIETTNGSRNEKILASEKEWIETLEQRFGIHFES
jgi:N-hydroxyarylamine O-acetyltransferase